MPRKKSFQLPILSLSKKEPLTDSTSLNAIFIQISAANLPYYFNHGIFYPLALEESEIYKNENRKNDALSEIIEYIPLSKKIINDFKHDEVLVEIITNNLKVLDIPQVELKYTSELIPISRITNIWFKSKESLNTVLSSNKTFPDCFIPEKLCKVLDTPLEAEVIDFKKVRLPPNLELESLKVVLRKFDKIMGMFAFMKNGALFFSEIENALHEYSPNYFNSLSLINSSIQPLSKDLGVFRYILFPLQIDASNTQRQLFRQILDRIYGEIPFDFEIGNQVIHETLACKISSPEEEQELKQILNYITEISSHKISFKEVINLDIVKKNLPVLALLFLCKFTNKSRQHTDKQAVRNIFISQEIDISKNTVDFLLAVLGLYYGYKSMIKSDTNLRFSDSIFKDLSEKIQSIKFKLESNLDRLLIESIYKFCMSGQSFNDNFSFLKYESPDTLSISSPKWGAFDYAETSVVIANTKIRTVERRSKIDRFLKLVEQSYPDNINSKYTLIHYLIANFGIRKKILLELLKEHESRVNLDELSRLIDHDKLFKK